MHGDAGDAQTACASGKAVEGVDEFLARAQSVAQCMVYSAYALDEAFPASQVDAGGGDAGDGAPPHGNDDGRLTDMPSQEGRAGALILLPEALDALGKAPDDGQSENECGGCSGEDEVTAVLAEGRVDQCEVAVVGGGPVPVAGGA